MLFWLPVLLLLLLVLAGFALLHVACGRYDPPVTESAGLEETRAWVERHEADAEDIVIQSTDGFTLHALFIPSVAERATLLLFHSWHSSWELDFGPALPFLYAQGVQLLLVDERAQGESEGQWITLGAREQEDAAAWASYLAERFGAGHPLLLYGAGMGATAVLAASVRRLPGNVRGIAAERPALSPYEMVSRAWKKRTGIPPSFPVWLLDLYTRLFAGFSLWEADAERAVAKTRYPVLLLDRAEDGLVTTSAAQRLYEACAGKKSLCLPKGAQPGANLLAAEPEAQEAFRVFLKLCLEDNMP